MEFTKVEIKLADDTSSHVRGYASVVLDHCLVIRDIRILSIQDRHLVAMPSRRVTRNCERCRKKFALGSNYCSNCGDRIPAMALSDSERQHVDVAHPINKAFREQFEEAVLTAFFAERQRQHGDAS